MVRFVQEYAPVQVGSDFVGLASAEGVALSAPSLEEGGTLRGITCGAARYDEMSSMSRKTSMKTLTCGERHFYGNKDFKRKKEEGMANRSTVVEKMTVSFN